MSHDGRDARQRARDDPARRDVPAVRPIELYALALGIVRLGERRRVRLFVERRRVRSLRVVPRVPPARSLHDRGARRRSSTRCNARSDGTRGRLHRARHRVGARSPARDRADAGAGDRRRSTEPRSKSELAAIARAWADDLRDALVAARGEEVGLDAFRVWRDAFPPRTRATSTATHAVADIAVLEDRRRSRDPARRRRRRCRRRSSARLKLYRSGAPLLLSDVMPVLEHLDVTSWTSARTRSPRRARAPSWIYSFGVRLGDGDALARRRTRRRGSRSCSSGCGRARSRTTG